MKIRLSLLALRSASRVNIIGKNTIQGKPHSAGGLNWGFSNGKSSPNDAYIPLHKQIILDNPNFFIRRLETENKPVEAIWDDGTVMQILFEGSQDINGVSFPKQIGTPSDKSKLGLYLRNRIGNKLSRPLCIPLISKNDFTYNASLYVDQFITLEMLLEYGRTDIGISRDENGIYHLDFSV